MNILKKLFVQSMVISTSILFLNGISAVIQHFRGTDLVLQWYHPLTIVLAGILCAVPTILLRDYDTWDRKTFRLRVALHCLATDTESFLSVSVIFFLVYAFVWLSSLWLDKQDEKKINRALDAIRDEE